jgi:hypothetical protein
VRAVAAAAALFVVIGATGRAASSGQSFGVVLDAKTGRAFSTIRVNGPIRAAIADGQGGWFVGGGFIRTNGALRKRLAHITSDGRLDPLWKPEANGNGVSVTSLTRVGSRLYVGGDFASLQHRPRLWVGAVDTHAGRALPWQPLRGGINYPVLLAGQDRVYLGGYGVRDPSGLAALRPDDARPAPGWHAVVDTSNIEGGGVKAMARLGGQLYIAGLFRKVNRCPGARARRPRRANRASLPRVAPSPPTALLQRLLRRHCARRRPRPGLRRRPGGGSRARPTLRRDALARARRWIRSQRPRARGQASLRRRRFRPARTRRGDGPTSPILVSALNAVRGDSGPVRRASADRPPSQTEP